MASSKVAQAAKLTKLWLHGEHAYQFGKNQVTHQADPLPSRDYIASREIPNKWGRYQFFRTLEISQEVSDSQLMYQAGQQVMKACAGARATVIWDRVSRGIPFSAANASTWQILHEHQRQLNDGNLAPYLEKLGEPCEAAIPHLEGQRPNYGMAFRELVSLSVAHLVDLEQRRGTMLLPQPGNPSGHIYPWSPPAAI